ncbi:MAG: hypothetical protein OHK0048_08010 [Rhodoferax sp.]
MTHRILVIDDEAPIRENLLRFLRLEGLTVEEAADGHAALAMLRSRPFDLVFCDVMMPHCDGFEVLRHMQADAALCAIPVVFLSASAEPEKLQDGLAMGARLYITKPFNLHQLRQALHDLLPPAAESAP